MGKVGPFRLPARDNTTECSVAELKDGINYDKY
jgi:hypothetical protein